MLNSLRSRLITIVPITIIVIGTAMLDYFLPSMGDDLAKWLRLGFTDYSWPDRSTISFILGQYVGCHGRLLDSLGPIIYYMLNPVVASIMMGLAAGAYFYVMARCARVANGSNPTAYYLLIIVALFVMPWGYAMYLRVCQFNYLWGTTLCMVTLYFLSSSRRNYGSLALVLLFVTAFLAAGSHEENAIAISAAAIPYCIIKYRVGELTRLHKTLLCALLLGTLVVLSSPALWYDSAHFIPDATPSQILFTTLPLVLLLIAVVFVMCLSESGRSKLISLVHGPWILYVIAAIAGSVVAIISTIPGRTGWLPQSMALVALMLMLHHVIPSRGMFSRAVIFFTLLLLLVHFGTAIKWQQIMNKEYTTMLKRLDESPNGTIFLDANDCYDVPVLTLYRVKGVPDANDLYLKRMIEKTYAPDKSLVIVPEAFRDKLPLAVDSVSYRDYTVYKSQPPTTTYTNIANERLLLHKTDGRVVLPFKYSNDTTYYLAAPNILDPGDVWNIGSDTDY